MLINTAVEFPFAISINLLGRKFTVFWRSRRICRQVAGQVTFAKNRCFQFKIYICFFSTQIAKKLIVNDDDPLWSKVMSDCQITFPRT